MDTFRCWVPDYGHEPDREGKNVEAYDAHAAAERYVELWFADLDYPSLIDVMVRLGDETKCYEVEVRAEPVFTARRKP